jgi:hypothetical protein
MRTISIPINIENLILSAAKNRKIIITNLSEASVYDSKAAKYLEEGNYEEAAFCTITAQEYLRIASEARREDIKLQALYN